MIKVINMSLVKADLNREKEDLIRLVNESEDSRKAYEEFHAKIALHQQLILIRKLENTHNEVSLR